MECCLNSCAQGVRLKRLGGAYHCAGASGCWTRSKAWTPWKPAARGSFSSLKTFCATFITNTRIFKLGYLAKGGNMAKSKHMKRELAEEIDLLDTMLSNLVELLEEKGILTHEEWEKRVKERVTIK